MCLGHYILGLRYRSAGPGIQTLLWWSWTWDAALLVLGDNPAGPVIQPCFSWNAAFRALRHRSTRTERKPAGPWIQLQWRAMSWIQPLFLGYFSVGPRMQTCWASDLNWLGSGYIPAGPALLKGPRQFSTQVMLDADRDVYVAEKSAAPPVVVLRHALHIGRNSKIFRVALLTV